MYPVRLNGIPDSVGAASTKERVRLNGIPDSVEEEEASFLYSEGRIEKKERGRPRKTDGPDGRTDAETSLIIDCAHNRAQPPRHENGFIGVHTKTTKQQ